jgi:hypothetical protein
MSVRRRHRLLLWLAFAGSLLLALVPSVGRLHQALAQQDPLAAQLGQFFCSADGLVARPDVSAWLAGASGKPAPALPAGGDCDYCPLLVAPALPVVTLSMPPAPRFPAATFPAPAQPALAQRHLIGWAPRGPPAMIPGAMPA